MKHSSYIILPFLISCNSGGEYIVYAENYTNSDQSIYTGYVALSERMIEIHVDTINTECRKSSEPEIGRCIPLGGVSGRCTPDDCISRIVVADKYSLDGERQGFYERGFHLRTEHERNVDEWVNIDLFGCMGEAHFGLQVPRDFEVPSPTLRVINYTFFARWEPQGANRIAITYPPEGGSICVMPDNGVFNIYVSLSEDQLGLDYQWKVGLLGRTNISLFRSIPVGENP